MEKPWKPLVRGILYIQEPLELTQAFRNFEGGSSAWEPVGPGADRKPDSFKLPTPKPEEPKEEQKK